MTPTPPPTPTARSSCATRGSTATDGRPPSLLRPRTPVLAVMIGVAFLAATYLLADTTFPAFDEIFEDSLAKTDVVITAKDAVRQETGEAPSFKAAVLPKVKRG